MPKAKPAGGGDKKWSRQTISKQKKERRPPKPGEAKSKLINKHKSTDWYNYHQFQSQFFHLKVLKPSTVYETAIKSMYK